MAGPLEGIRIVDAGIYNNGPLALVFLSDMGAEVIKIEDPIKGDPVRAAAGPLSPNRQAINHLWEAQDRNKKSLTLDFKKPQAQEVLERLTPTVDVFCHNYRVGVAERLGFDYKTLSKYNPRIIYAWNSGLGDKGPYRHLGIIDGLGQAWSGLMSIEGEPDRPPVFMPASVSPADCIGAMGLAYGITLAILARERYGFGQEIYTSQLGSLIMAQMPGIQGYLINHQLPEKTSRSRARNPLYNVYQASDGKWLMLGCVQPDRYWPGVCRALGLEHLMEDPRFSSITARTDNASALTSILATAFACLSAAEAFKRLAAEDVLASPVHDYADLAQDPQVIENGYVVDFDHPTYGSIKVTGIPIKLSKTPGRVQAGAPEYGQHTEELLSQLGYSWEEMEALRAQGVI